MSLNEIRTKTFLRVLDEALAPDSSLYGIDWVHYQFPE